MSELAFNGQVALVTGASRGLGAAISVELAKRGAHVLMLARSKKGLERTDDIIRQNGGTATLILSDLRKPSDVEALGPALAERYGKLDILVGNAAILGPLMPLTHMPADVWADIIDTNLNANFRLIRMLDPLLRAAPAARALFVTSSVASKPRAFWSAYSASKAALVSLVATYAAESVHTNVKANCIDPGGMRTEMRASAFPGEDADSLPLPEIVAHKLLPLLAESCPHNGAHLKASDL